MQLQLLLIICKKGENFTIIKWASSQENFWLLHSTYEPVLTSAAATPASCSLTFTFCGRGFLIDQLHWSESVWVALYTYRPTKLFPAQFYIFPTSQRILTLPEDTLFWKAYQDALLSIALSHPLHRKASKSPWIFFYRDETVVFCIIKENITKLLYKFQNDHLHLHWIFGKDSGCWEIDHVIYILGNNKQRIPNVIPCVKTIGFS